MNLFGIEMKTNSHPSLDPDFIPIARFNRSFLASAGTEHPVGIAVEGANGCVEVLHTYIHGTEEMREADCYYIDRAVKTMLWMKGGFRVFVSGDRTIFAYLQEAYGPDGARAFDAAFMSRTYEKSFEVCYCESLPAPKDNRKPIGGHLEGCRIGFDAGGSDRKVSAVIDGESVFAEETVWHPKTMTDPEYHYQGIREALTTAAAHLPRVDAVGVSTAGIVINDQIMQASLFQLVPLELWAEKVKNIYIRAVRDTFGDIPLAVANDGDVSAIAGVMSIGDNSVLGIAMGTSEAGGFVDENGCVTGWLNELAFIPVDCARTAMLDEWGQDIGCGVKYFSQDAVIKLAPRAGIELDEGLTPAEKLKEVQALMEGGHSGAAAIYDSIGVYLGHTLAFYHDLYAMRHVLLLGRVMSGKGGDRILRNATEVLAKEYPEIAAVMDVRLPDEKFRRVGQSAAAAGLAEVEQ